MTNPQFPVDLVTFIEDILNGKLHFCEVKVHETIERHPGCFLNVLCMFSLRPAPEWKKANGITPTEK